MLCTVLQFLFVDKLQQENTQLHHQIKQLQQQVSGRYGHSAQAQALAAPTASAQLAAVQVAPAARGPNVAEAYVDAKDPAEEQQQQQQEMLMVEGSMHGHVGVHVLPAPAAYVAGGIGPGSTVHEAAGAAGAAAGCHLQRASSNVASTAATTHGSTAALQLLPANGIHTARAELHRLLQACVDMLPRAKAEDAHAEQQAQAQLAAAESAQSILHKQLHAAQVECTALQAQHVAAMEGWRSENASLSSQLANAQAATSSAERQRDTALTDAAAQAQTAADLQQMNESVQAAQLAAVEAFAKRESALQVQLGTLAEQLQAMQQEAAIGKGKQKELEGHLRQAQKASIEVQTQLRDWQDECKRAEEGWKLRCDRAEANESLAKHLVTELEGQLAEGRAAAQAAAAEVEAATRNHARVNNITAQRDHAQRDAAGARKLVQQLQRQLQQEREQRTTDHDMAGAGQQERNSGTTEPEVIDLRDED